MTILLFSAEWGEKMMKTTVLLVNLGSPRKGTPWAVYRYLVEFLTDPLVIRLPFWKRQLLVRGIIALFRCRESAKSYRAIWTNEGSPLLYWGRRVKEALQESLGPSFEIRLAMRYKIPSIKEALKKPYEQLIVVPLFPQHAGSTSGSIIKETLPYKPKILRLKPDHPKMIRAMASRVREDFDHLVMSFHGLPVSHKDARAYQKECYKTAEALAKELQLEEGKYTIAFQSRLGKEPWIEPYTSDVLMSLRGKRVAVISPAFVADCLETLYEIDIDYRSQVLKDLVFVPCMNDHPLWIESLKEQIEALCLSKQAIANKGYDESIGLKLRCDN